MRSTMASVREQHVGDFFHRAREKMPYLERLVFLLQFLRKSLKCWQKEVRTLIRSALRPDQDALLEGLSVTLLDIALILYE